MRCNLGRGDHTDLTHGAVTLIGPATSHAGKSVDDGGTGDDGVGGEDIQCGPWMQVNVASGIEQRGELSHR